MPDNTFINNEFRNNFSNDNNTVSNNDLLQELQSQSKLLNQINSSLEKMVSSSQGNRYQYEEEIRNAYNSNGRNNATAARERQGAQKTRSNSGNTFGRSTDQDIDDIKKTIEKLKRSLDEASNSFEKSLKDSLFTNSFSSSMNGYLKKLANSLGTEIEDLPKLFGQQLGKGISNYIKNSDNAFAKRLNGLANSYDKLQEDLANTTASTLENISKKLFPNVDIDFGITKDNQKKADKSQNAESEGITKQLDSGLTSFKSNYKNTKDIYIETASISVGSTVSKNNRFIDYPEFEALTNEPETEIPRQVKMPDFGELDFTEGGLQDLFGDLSSGFKGIFKNIGGFFTNIAGPIASEGAGAASALGGLALGALSVAGPLVALEAITTSLGADFKQLFGSLSGLFTQLKKTMQRYDEASKQVISNATNRLMEDVETIVREPFKILEDAANKVYEVWDENLRLINGTQGYTKEDLQDLMSNYAARLQAEGLSSVVSAADITDELAKVLNAGLSGAAAEEFAYIATVLNAAIPTQDFFDYADTYVSIAGNMIAQGYSQSEALEYANEQLEIFASNTLYASRELAGGFTTGLQNASDIFTQSIQIAQTAGSNNAAEISSVLTAVAAVTGSIAPDLATTMTDLIYSAATGGNSSELVALRSLAETGASNTDFLNSLINDPQSVFVTMFKNLDKLINTSNDNYMEVAESLSEIFGISTEALRRIDFNYLADAIANMNVSDASLSENLALLASGETTTSAEQLRMQQINEYMLEEGLAYVVDNEAARFIQEHMWEEQIADALMDATYGVELVGGTKELLESIKEAILNIMTLGLRKLVSAVSNSITSHREENAEIEDLEAILEAGKVGSGNAQDLYNLTTRGVNLNLTDDLVTLLTGQQGAYSQVSKWNSGSVASKALGTGYGRNTVADVVSSPTDASSAGYHSISSMYTWSTNVSKSVVSSAGMLSGGTATGSSATPVSTTSSTSETQSRLQSKVEQMLSEDYIRGIIEEGGNYEDWQASARKLGISDISSTLDDLGYIESEVESYFDSVMATMSAEESDRFYAREEEFWGNVEDWLEQIYTFMDESIYQDALMNSIYQDALVDSIYQDALNDKLYETSFKKDGMYKELKAFYDGWYDYIYQHNAYNDSYDYSNVASIQSKEKTSSQDAVYALAEELTKNTVDLKEPTMQTNALLAEILIVVNAIMQSENAETSATSLTDTLSGLALGLFNTSTT